MSTAHRSIDGTSLHSGFIDDCTKCNSSLTESSASTDDGDPYIEPDPLDFGAPQPVWARLYARLVARFGKY